MVQLMQMKVSQHCADKGKLSPASGRIMAFANETTHIVGTTLPHCDSMRSMSDHQPHGGTLTASLQRTHCENLLLQL